ncbi:MAG: hypothetical protein LGL72_12575 [Acidibrevibacterium sp.]|jgi:hypothetical protein|uniref:hypothetical protein n=1 Tax=Acidibrevibacterium fodinaquatile TaxID=1969806 RepID=UPI0023A8EB0D|nr:hypothetical protein [Acidibrevibacterium fodinaquatile]MCA7120217.1 hypothetical protein [Acidibrevibacterium fodinaquatile]
MTRGPVCWPLVGVALLAAAGASLAARADEAPRLTPSRDVDITYRVLNGDKPMVERVRWLAAEDIERIDPHGKGYILGRSAYMLIDHRGKTADIIDPKTRSVTVTVNPVAGELAEIENAKLTPLGDATIAKLPCKIWRAEIAVKVEREICLTEDGVLLQVRDGEKTLLEAQSVTYHHLSSKLFNVPPNYKASANTQALPGTAYGGP